ncbi:Lrp/AsnC ligand binding domain-containing protein [Ignisphaera sp. 4213-co]|uniref:Lrp/AsnC ligand binding domain-containing protein n=1 Tax=Ignisphaera cupida TaxID=3050454 RepID=A0ABD4Z3W3_9CREN|nr:Lrp/AsnC ligand binding domain-containing protein [Ignisphaera sp. 4213-co]MDK6027819.1 Lrp/AsnC ligand binding domain-containing protein [Ignisphaera sp. 4213-co]
MPEALILINTDVGAEDEVLAEIKNVEGVKEAFIVYGIYDLYAKIEADTIEKLKDIVSSKIRKIPKVRSTITMIIVSTKNNK